MVRGPLRRRGADQPCPEADELTGLVAAARDGDEAAFAALYRSVQPKLLRYLRVLVNGDSHAAEDVAAEAWLQIVRDLPRFRGDGDEFRAWSATIARNRALDLHRRAASRPQIADVAVETLHSLPAQENVSEAALARLGTGRAIALLATLPPDQAEAVVLRAVVGLDGPTAAQVLGKQPGAVRMAAHRGLATLAATLAERGAAPAVSTSEAPARPGVTEIPTSALKGVR